MEVFQKSAEILAQSLQLEVRLRFWPRKELLVVFQDELQLLCDSVVHKRGVYLVELCNHLVQNSCDFHTKPKISVAKLPAVLPAVENAFDTLQETLENVYVQTT
ncbi:hypothetical protein OGAPHI_002136 [Ogataea philodendri]|uniref:Uncharacterized protein n=1 Tax=Ogataea philodendri TaxID=1378263 RepID=A0A9P8PBP7_9ASCO|nr:uncharacterized protein OGAPHI_002136 [Ogataea philodendri]KAH3668382.1 hypothetical protein OGAPHI_002136 [Ogataea philodendri]